MPRKFRNSLEPKLKKCNFCDNQHSSYTCSRCMVPYCSAECFRSPKHLECSEIFFKKCVIEQLKYSKNSDEEQKRFMEMLKRNSMLNDKVVDPDVVSFDDILQELCLDDIEGGDSDQQTRIQNFIDKISERLELSDSVPQIESIWDKLSLEEQEEFVRLVDGNRSLFDSLIDQWKPWWLCEEYCRIVIDDDDQCNSSNQYPQLCTKLSRLDQLLKSSKSPSPTIGNSLLSIVYGYCYLCRLYNGEISACAHQSDKNPTPIWTLEIFHQLCRICPQLTDSSVNFSTPLQALDSALTASLGPETTDQPKESKQFAIQLLSDVLAIFDFVDKPGRKIHLNSSCSSKTYRAPKAILLVLSDLVHILVAIGANCQQQTTTESCSKQIRLARKKLQFYMSWTLEFGEDILEKQNKLFLECAHFYLDKLHQENAIFEQDKQIQTECPRTSDSTNNKNKTRLIEELN